MNDLEAENQRLRQAIDLAQKAKHESEVKVLSLKLELISIAQILDRASIHTWDGQFSLSESARVEILSENLNSQKELLAATNEDLCNANAGEIEERTLKHFDHWHEDYGPALWWKIKPGELGEAAQFVGTPLGSDWPWGEDETRLYWIKHPNVIIPDDLLNPRDDPGQ